MKRIIAHIAIYLLSIVSLVAVIACAAIYFNIPSVWCMFIGVISGSILTNIFLWHYQKYE